MGRAMGSVRAVAANERVQGIDTMYQTGFAQEFQRPVNRGWLHRARIAVGQCLQQVVGTYRPVTGPNQFKYTAP